LGEAARRAVRIFAVRLAVFCADGARFRGRPPHARWPRLEPRQSTSARRRMGAMRPVSRCSRSGAVLGRRVLLRPSSATPPPGYPGGGSSSP